MLFSCHGKEYKSQDVDSVQVNSNNKSEEKRQVAEKAEIEKDALTFAKLDTQFEGIASVAALTGKEELY